MPWKKPAAWGFLLLVILLLLSILIAIAMVLQEDPKIMMLIGILLGGLIN